MLGVGTFLLAVSIHALCAPTPLAKLAGTPAVIPALQQRAASGVSPMQYLPECFPFPLDGFQLDALEALHGGQSVVVSAPTGSGKTVCGELGCYLALARGQRVIYTTPLKALSNQKFYDLQQQFGPVGGGSAEGARLPEIPAYAGREPRGGAR